MKIGIIGGGASGVFAAIRIKKLHPDFEVSIFEHNDKLLKKIFATGNGKCNFANVGSLNNKYQNETFALPIINKFNAKDLIAYFEEIGIHSKQINNLVYPVSETAQTVVLMLLKQINQLGIDVHLNEDVTDYEIGFIKTNRGSYFVDKIIISTGGKAAPQLGSDGQIFDILKNHGYQINYPSPCLTSILINENVKRLDGLRQKGLIKVFDNEKLIYQEEGEILFRKQGLSGICVFNSTLFINQTDKKNIKIHIDFAPSYKKEIEPNDYLEFVHPDLADYLTYNKHNIHKVIFTFKDFSSYENAQVTFGGVSISCLNNDLSSKLENNVYFVGEVIDVCGVCGGFNLMWAFASSNLVTQIL